jgi:predicted CXXCH cytochrome family protein
MNNENMNKWEVKIMKKIFLFTMLVMAVALLIPGHTLAVTGQCSNCHTMHDSQGGSDQGSSGAQSQLLLASCAACHTTSGTGQTTSRGAPAVLHSSGTASGSQGAGETNAGGDFYWVINTGDAYGHNVADISGLSSDSTIGNTPPGWDYEATKSAFSGYSFGQITGGDNASWSTQLTCAGTFGCHGNHSSTNSLQAISGAHHNNANTGGGITATSASTASTTANSYRFLAGIKGLEDANWNWSETASTHNEYYGQNDTATERDDDSTDVYSNTDTISFFCAECHGNFHSRIDADATFGSPWVRHPTDIVLPNSGEFDDYNSDNGDNTAGSYSLSVPVARGAVPTNAQGSSSTVTPGDSTTRTGAIVMCLSCHRAHGSPYADMLRFDYANVTVGSGNTTGCFVCHTDKN